MVTANDSAGQADAAPIMIALRMVLRWKASSTDLERSLSPKVSVRVAGDVAAVLVAIPRVDLETVAAILQEVRNRASRAAVLCPAHFRNVQILNDDVLAAAQSCVEEAQDCQRST